MKLIPIGQYGTLPKDVIPDEHLRAIIDTTIQHYERTGFSEPWIGYIARDDSGTVGVCGFKSAPVDGRVEIAYGTLPGHEGKGVATSMAQELVRITCRNDERLVVFAQTLPKESASTTILRKLGFALSGSVQHVEDGTVWEWELQR